MRAKSPERFYGWHLLIAATVVRGFTAPGQTIGLSAFTDDFIESLSTTRSSVASAYLVGTLAGALALPMIGRWTDRVGVQRAMAFIVAGFCLAILFAGAVANIAMLALAFVGLRMLGQGALTLVGTQSIVLWFDRRRGFALAMASTGTIAIMATAPLVFTALIDRIGWRATFVVVAAGVALVLGPIVRWAIVDRPADLGQRPDGAVEDADTTAEDTGSATVSQAVRTPAFWALIALSVMASAIVTGLTFHNVDLLAERGFDPTQAAAVFLPQMVGGIVAGFVFGWLSDSVDARPLLFGTGALLAIGTALAATTSPGIDAVFYGLALGAAIGAISSLLGALLPKWFGIEHIGAIKGLAHTTSVAASAVGPLILSLGNDAAGSYRPVVFMCAVACGAAAVLCSVTPAPSSAQFRAEPHEKTNYDQPMPSEAERL